MDELQHNKRIKLYVSEYVKDVFAIAEGVTVHNSENEDRRGTVPAGVTGLRYVALPFKVAPGVPTKCFC